MNPLAALGISGSTASQPFKTLVLAAAAFFCAAGSLFAASGSTVTLAWNANPEPDIQSYELQYGTASGNRPDVVSAGKALSVAVTGLNPGTTYYFAVVARNTAGQASPPSAEIAYTVPGTPNTAPVAAAGSLALAEDTEAALTLGASDAEEDSLSYSIASAPAKGVLIGTPPNLTYRPAANQTGSDSFTFRAFDGVLHSAPATVSIAISPVNDPPAAAAKSVTVIEDTATGIALPGTDVDGDTLSYIIVSPPGKGTLSGSGANRSYQPAANATGSDSFTYKVSDGSMESAPATVSITITPVNDPPVATPRTATTAEDTAVPVVLAGTDVEGASLSFAIASPPANGSLSGSPPNLTYTPKANFHGADSFTFRVNDGSANSAAAAVGITVTPVNDAPVANSRSISTGRNTAVAATLTATDVEGNALTYTVLSQPANGTLGGSPPNLTYTPENGYTGSDSFTFRASDGTLNSGTATITISVTNINRAPSAHPKSLTTMPKRAVGVTLEGSDPDGNTLSYRITSEPENGTLSGTPPNLSYRPRAKWSGEDRFTFVVNDGSTDSAEATVSVKVKKKNLKPVATRQSVTANQNGTLSIVLEGSDPDGDALSFLVAAKPKKGSLSGTPPNLVYTPQAGYRGKDRFTFQASDGFAKSRPALVEINVINPDNKAPVAQSATYDTPANKALPILLAATDADGDKITYRLTAKPASGKLKGKLPKLNFRAKKGFTGTLTFTYVASDGELDSAPATITIRVSAPEAPARRSAPAGSGEPAPLPVLALRSHPGKPGVLLLEISGTPGETYTLQHSGDLGEWTDEREVTLDENGRASEEAEMPPGRTAGFYRLSGKD